jgi:phosphoglycolate phosphatase
LDNTLYDWVSYFVQSFYAMVDEVVKLTGCDREQLLNEFREIHQRHHDSEHPFALLETPTVQARFAGLTRKEVALRLDSAFHAFNSSRKQNLKLYPGVREALDKLSASGIVLVAHTESKLFSAVDRLARLHLEKYFRRIYCRERTDVVHPDPEAASKWLRQFPLYKVRELSHHQRKPDPTVLLEICGNESVESSMAAYVGDSIVRDILMAKDAAVFAVWAKYGAAQQRADYEKLVRITHWTEEDVARERAFGVRASGVVPDFILEERFDEILELVAATEDAPLIGRR